MTDSKNDIDKIIEQSEEQLNSEIKDVVYCVLVESEDEYIFRRMVSDQHGEIIQFNSGDSGTEIIFTPEKFKE